MREALQTEQIGVREVGGAPLCLPPVIGISNFQAIIIGNLENKIFMIIEVAIG